LREKPLIKNIKALGFLAIGAFALSAVYALIVKDNAAEHAFDDGDAPSARHTINGDSGEFVLTDEDFTIKAAWRGDYSLNDAGAALAELDDELEIEIKQGGVKERVKFERSNGAIGAIYYRDGDKLPKGGEADQAAAALFLKFLRISGLKSDERVSALLKAGGAASVLEEFNALERDRAKRRYSVALIEQSDLSPTDIDALSQTFESIASDHDLRIAMTALIENETLTAAQVARLLTIAGRQIESDHDLRLVLSASAGFFSANDDFASAWMDAYARLQSSYDQRLALGKIAAAAKGDPALLAAYRKAAQAISDDADRERALEAIGEETER
jgi:hypothetical protein